MEVKINKETVRKKQKSRTPKSKKSKKKKAKCSKEVINAEKPFLYIEIFDVIYEETPEPAFAGTGVS